MQAHFISTVHTVSLLRKLANKMPCCLYDSHIMSCSVPLYSCCCSVLGCRNCEITIWQAHIFKNYKMAHPDFIWIDIKYQNTNKKGIWILVSRNTERWNHYCSGEGGCSWLSLPTIFTSHLFNIYLRNSTCYRRNYVPQNKENFAIHKRWPPRIKLISTILYLEALWYHAILFTFILIKAERAIFYRAENQYFIKTKRR